MCAQKYIHDRHYYFDDDGHAPIAGAVVVVGFDCVDDLEEVVEVFDDDAGTPM